MPKLITASIQQRNLVTDYFNHGNKAKAYRDNYADAGKYNTLRANKVLNHPATREHIHRVLNKAGATPEVVSNVLGKIMDEVDNPKVMGQITPSHVLKAAEMTATLQDMNPAEKKKIEKRTLSLNLEGKSIEELTGMLNTLVEEANTFKRMMAKESVRETIKDATILP